MNSCGFSKVFKYIKIFLTVHLKSFIRNQGKNLDLFWIWWCFKLFLYCLLQPNHVIHFFFHIIFIVRIRLWFFQTVTLYYPSEILLFKVFIDACKLTGEMPIDWSFFLGVWYSVNPLSVSVTDWNLSWSSIQGICL